VKFSKGLFALLCVAGTGGAFGNTVSLPLSGTIVNQNPSSGVCTSTATAQCAESYGFAAGSVSSGGYGTVVSANPTSYTIGDTFNQAIGAVVQTQSDFGISAYSTSNCSAGNCTSSTPFLNWNFQDNYQFATPASGTTVSGAVVSFTSGTSGLSDLEARIIETSSNTPQALIGLNGGGVTVVDGWTTMAATSGGLTLYTASLQNMPLTPGQDYILQIRGEAAASAATYNGNVVFTAVPLPAGIWLLGSALASAAGFIRRRGISIPA
jgi:predicted extracellular nuclease